VSKKVSNLFGLIRENKAEFTLIELFDIFDLPPAEGTLDKVGKVQSKLEEWNLVVVPDVDRGEIESVRRVCFQEKPRISVDEVRAEIDGGENARVELKSSLLFDHLKAQHHRDASPAELKSDEVLFSSLKTMAGFLNSDGGVLYVGVNDQGESIGIEFDFPLISSKPERQTLDGWQLFLRATVETSFKDGRTINDYVDCTTYDIAGRNIARIIVSPRRQLSFVKKGNGGCLLYRRNGNRTENVAIENVEEFIARRNSVYSETQPRAGQVEPTTSDVDTVPSWR
jgi:hypothetical protein